MQAHRRTCRHVALLILAVVFHETPAAVQVALIHPTSISIGNAARSATNSLLSRTPGKRSGPSSPPRPQRLHACPCPILQTSCSTQRCKAWRDEEADGAAGYGDDEPLVTIQLINRGQVPAFIRVVEAIEEEDSP